MGKKRRAEEENGAEGGKKNDREAEEETPYDQVGKKKNLHQNRSQDELGAGKVKKNRKINHSQGGGNVDNPSQDESGAGKSGNAKRKYKKDRSQDESETDRKEDRSKGKNVELSSRNNSQDESGTGNGENVPKRDEFMAENGKSKTFPSHNRLQGESGAGNGENSSTKKKNRKKDRLQGAANDECTAGEHVETPSEVKRKCKKNCLVDESAAGKIESGQEAPSGKDIHGHETTETGNKKKWKKTHSNVKQTDHAINNSASKETHQDESRARKSENVRHDHEPGKEKVAREKKREKNHSETEAESSKCVKNLDHKETDKKRKRKKAHSNVEQTEDSANDVENNARKESGKEKKKKKKEKSNDNVVDKTTSSANEDSSKDTDNKKKSKKQKTSHSNDDIVEKVANSGNEDQLGAQQSENVQKKTKKKKTAQNDSTAVRDVEKSANQDTHKKKKKVTFGETVVFNEKPVERPVYHKRETEPLYGKNFTEEEDNIIRETVQKFIKDRDLDKEETYRMLISSKRDLGKSDPDQVPLHQEIWSAIGSCVPRRSASATKKRAKAILDIFSKTGKWSDEEIDWLMRLVDEHGKNWVKIAKIMGRKRMTVSEKYNYKIGQKAKGAYTNEEISKITRAVHQCITENIKLGVPKMKVDDISWKAIAKAVPGRPHSHWRVFWYRDLCSGMVKTGEWSNSDDQRLLLSIMESGAAEEESIEWDNLLPHRSGEACRKRWNQMRSHLGHRWNWPLEKKLEILVERYAPSFLQDEPKSCGVEANPEANQTAEESDTSDED